MSYFLSHLESPRGANKRKKRLGRGDASGHGGTSTKGHKGQRARSGGYHKLGFEGGQNPLIRRIPKRGFTNIFKRYFEVVNVGDLAMVEPGVIVDPQYMHSHGLLRSIRENVKILGSGDLNIGVVVHAHEFSKSAIEKIEKAGGKVVKIDPKAEKK